MALWQADQQRPKFPSDDSAPSHGLSQVVLEGSLVNLDVTSPAATLALTLMFLKTNERTVADMLVLPDTTFNLDFIRPTCILLRVVARSLIMWDSIEPSEEWVMKQMPDVVSMRWPDALNDIKAAVAEGREFDHEAVLLAHIHAVAGACLALGLRYAGAPSPFFRLASYRLSLSCCPVNRRVPWQLFRCLQCCVFTVHVVVRRGLGGCACRNSCGGGARNPAGHAAVHPAVPQDPRRDQGGCARVLHRCDCCGAHGSCLCDLSLIHI